MKFLFIFLILTIVCLLVFIALQPTVQKTIQPKLIKTNIATFSPTPDTMLSLLPETLSLATTSSATLTVHIDTGKNTITRVQLEIAYDPKILTDVQIFPATFFQNPRITYFENNRKSGRLTYTITDQTDKPISGTDKLAYLSFSKQLTASSAAQTKITILPKTLVTLPGIPFSVLKQTTGATILISE